MTIIPWFIFYWLGIKTTSHEDSQVRDENLTGNQILQWRFIVDEFFDLVC
jgi:hypothetical protein